MHKCYRVFSKTVSITYTHKCYTIVIYIYIHISNNGSSTTSNNDTTTTTTTPNDNSTPNAHTKSFPIKSPLVKLSGRLPIKVHGHENPTP